MQNDEIIWQVINNHFCSFKYKTNKDTFCRNDKNVTGMCNRTSCPLANSNYGTIIEDDGNCFLYLKTVERAHTPKLLWEKIKLSKNYKQAIQQIDQNMTNIYAKHQILLCKQRLTRIRQTLVRKRRLELQPQVKLLAVKKKTDRREETREKKAEKAAQLDVAIENELLNRLKKGTYGDLYKEAEPEKEVNTELQNDIFDEPEIDKNDYGNIEFFEDDFDEDDFEETDEDDEPNPPTHKTYSSYPPLKQRRIPHIEIEYEDEQQESNY